MTRYLMLALCFAPASQAQEPTRLYSPRTFQRAVARGTRSDDGRPGPRYWQNRARYVMTVDVTPPDRLIRGSETITYFNASPDTLRQLAFKLIMNYRRPGATSSFPSSEEGLNSGVTVRRFAVNGAPLPWRAGAPTTNRVVALPQPLLPRDSVQLAFDWEYPLSAAKAREGVIDSTTFYLAYFYPRVSVYDDIDGWDLMEHTGAQEFYNGFNDYDVMVRVPAHFVVWGTGTLRNADEVLTPAIAGRYQASLTSDATINVATGDEMRRRAVTRSAGVNTWRFTATNVPDVAIGLSDHYAWNAGSVVVDPSRPRVSVQAAYNDTAPDLPAMVRLIQGSLGRISTQWPGRPYPYEKTTIFQGDAGMEYPMMVNDEAYADTIFSRFVAAHEILHTYFPFYMGINETRYSFMDEGWATALEYLLNQVEMGPERAVTFFQQFRVNPWAANPSALNDLPIITPADVLFPAGWGNNAYGKAALGYLALKDLLGDDTFRRGFHAFIDRWNGRHPTPWDMFNTFNDATGQNLNWFWQSWFFSGGHTDLAIDRIAPRRGGYIITLGNRGGWPSPVDIELRYTDGTAETLHQTPAIWSSGRSTSAVTLTTGKRLESARLNGGIFVDSDSTNNQWRSN